MESTLGEIITFYSYKGGVGRSMALANVACLLAQKQESGNNVLMIDWDLEAPGLHQFFHGRFDSTRNEQRDLPSEQLGVIDLFYEVRNRLKKSKSKNKIPDDVFSEIDVQKYIVKVDQPSLFLMPAGKFGDGLYSTRVNEFDWAEFFNDFPSVITQFAQHLRKKYKHVLIDSRTGYTDISGICTSIMPEKLVTVFTPNRQSLSGVIELIRRAIDYRKQSDDLRPLMIFPLPSRIENAESKLQKEWRFGNPNQGIEGYQTQLESVLKDVYGLQACDLTEYFDEYQLQYIPRYSYGEEIAVLSERSEDRLSLARSFENFAEKIISNENPWGMAEDLLYRDAKEDQKSKEPTKKATTDEKRYIASEKKPISRRFWLLGWTILLLVLVMLLANYAPFMDLFFPPPIWIGTPTSISEQTPSTYPSTPSSNFTPVSVTNTPSVAPALFSCDPQYPPNQDGWESSYEAISGTILLEELFTQIYGGVRRDNLDLYAVAYYNNRKAIEDNSYHSIDPVKLTIQKGWRIFLPPPSWIDIYRDFPIPILESINEDDAYPNINISGTSMLYPLSSQISKCFMEATIPYRIDIESVSNTKLGLIHYCQGRVDVFGGSEEITPEMLIETGCTSINFLKFEIAVDAVTLFINQNNPYANDLIEAPLTKEELKRLLFSANTWNEVRSNWGVELINRYFPPQESGTFEVVKNEFFLDLNAESSIPHLVIVESDSILIGKVVNDVYSIGFSRYENYRQNNSNLLVLPVDNVSPNLETIRADDSGYPLTRKLYLYTSTTTYSERPLLRYFINYYLAYEFDFIDKLGYFYPNNNNILRNPNTIP